MIEDTAKIEEPAADTPVDRGAKKPRKKRERRDTRRSEKVHTPMPVLGYVGQKEAATDAVNKNKIIEELMLRRLDELAADPVLAVDGRWLQIGRTELEKAFMAINRAVFKPERVKDV